MVEINGCFMLKNEIDNAYVDDLRSMADIEYNPQVTQYNN